MDKYGEAIDTLFDKGPLAVYCVCGWHGSTKALVSDDLGNSDCCPSCGEQTHYIDKYIYRVTVNLQESQIIDGLGYITTFYIFVQGNDMLSARKHAGELMKLRGWAVLNAVSELALIQTPELYNQLFKEWKQ